MEEKTELVIGYVIGVNKMMQEVSVEANTLRHRDRLGRIVIKINKMIEAKEDPIKVLAFILRSFPIEQIFSNANHRTAYAIFADYCVILGVSGLREKITL